MLREALIGARWARARVSAKKRILRRAHAARNRLYELSGKCALRIGMGCKAQNAAIAVAIARICNAADRPRPQMHTAR